MSKYFKVPCVSETGIKLACVVMRMEEAADAQKAICDKYGFTSYRPNRWYVTGGIEGFDEPKEDADLLHFRKNNVGDYVPKLRSKEGKAIAAEIEALPVVTNRQLGSLVGENNVFNRIGFAFHRSDFYLIKTNDDVMPPEDCIEITFTEHKNLLENG